MRIGKSSPEFFEAYAELVAFMVEIEQHGLVQMGLERFQRILMAMQEQVEQQLEKGKLWLAKTGK